MAFVSSQEWHRDVPLTEPRMQSKKRGFCFTPFFKHFRVQKMCGASVHRSTRLLKIVFQQPGSLELSVRRLREG